MDATIILYRLESNGSITFVAADDISGGFSNGQKVNNNAMLVYVPADNADYLIFATTSDTQPNGTGNYSVRLIGNAGRGVLVDEILAFVPPPLLSSSTT